MEILNEVWTGKIVPLVIDDHNPCLVLPLNGRYIAIILERW